MSKDPFQILADELTLIRKDMDRLQRTSRDKDEAKGLHDMLAQAVDRMERAAENAPASLQNTLRNDRNQVVRNATAAAASAAQSVLTDVAGELAKERDAFRRAAGEARREAWRWFGGFWVWLASIGATGALLGALAAFWITGRGDAREFGRFPSIYCGNAGGQVVEQDNGGTFCAIWIKRPPQSGN